jgi:Tfp pilus assembly protein FimT
MRPHPFDFRHPFGFRHSSAFSASSSRNVCERGWTFSELLAVLTLIALGAQAALPSWQVWQERQQARIVRERLRMDVQAARVQAMQAAQALTLQAIRDCPWYSRRATDWSCGWQLIDPLSQRTLQTTALTHPMNVSFTKSLPLDVSARGDVGQVGDRWTVQPRTTTGGLSGIAQSICLSGAGRLRVVAGATCS